MAIYKFTIGDYSRKRISPNFRFLTGQRFSRLLVIGYAGRDKRSHAMWHVLCDCGNGLTTVSSSLLRGQTKSCGCYKLEVFKRSRHGHSRVGKRSPEMYAYTKARQRCRNPKDPKYYRYGGRGIEFRFNTFEEFYDVIGDRPSNKHSLNRIDNNGHYEKGNIEWATYREQANNTSINKHLTAFGKTQTISEFAREYGLDMHCFYARLQNKWCIECALTIPSGKGRCPHRKG